MAGRVNIIPEIVAALNKSNGRRRKAQPAEKKDLMATLSIQLDADLVQRIKAHKDWRKMVRTMMHNQFD